MRRLKIGKSRKKINGESWIFHGTTFRKRLLKKYREAAKKSGFLFRSFKRHNKELGTYYQMWVKRKKKGNPCR